jgi:hypothetical protein
MFACTRTSIRKRRGKLFHWWTKVRERDDAKQTKSDCILQVTILNHHLGYFGPKIINIKENLERGLILWGK